MMPSHPHSGTSHKNELILHSFFYPTENLLASKWLVRNHAEKTSTLLC